MKKAFCLSLLVPFINITNAQTVVVTAEKVKRSYSNSTSSIVSISREEIDSSQASDLPELLKSKAGIATFSNSSFGKASTVLLRGNDNRHTLIELDGVVINDVTGIAGAPRLEFLPLDLIESIEVIKGSQSVLYGSGAIGGVVKITTRKSDTPVTSVSVGYGSYNNQQASFNTSGKNGNISYSLTGASQKVDGISAYNEDRLAFSEKDEFDNLSLFGKIKYQVSKTDEIDFLLGRSSSTYDFDSSTGDVINSTSTVKTSLVGLKYFKNINNFLKPSLEVSNYDISRDLISSGSYFPYSGRQQEVELENKSYFGMSQLLSGIKYSTETAKKLGSTSDKSRDNERVAFYLNSNTEISKLNIDLGVRRETYKFFEDENVYKVGANLEVLEGLSIKSSYSTGVKSPSLYQTFSSLGNKSLKAEKSKSFEAGFIMTHQLFNLEAVYFNTSYRDYINAIEISPSTYQYSNTNKAEIDGYEVSLDTTIAEKLILDLNYTHLDALDKTNGTYLLRRPRSSASLNITLLQSDSLEFGLLNTFVGRRADSSTVTLGSYVVTHLTSRYRVNNKQIIDFKIGNLLDREYEQVSSFGTPDRNYNIKYTHRF
tara:strand:- start:92884 stop:94677 length:1794 start_codon:yes stop_codon:yes gene_type:complete